MLFILRDDITSVNFSGGIELASLENLLLSIHFGNHFLLSSRDVSKWLVSHIDNFSPMAKGVIIKVNNSFDRVWKTRKSNFDKTLH